MPNFLERPEDEKYIAKLIDDKVHFVNQFGKLEFVLVHTNYEAETIKVKTVEKNSGGHYNFITLKIKDTKWEGEDAKV